MRLVLLPLFIALAVGCPDGAKDSDATGGNDSGDTADIDLGPPGCINLNGEEGDFASITEALGYAAAGDTVNVCAGAYSENVVLDVGVHIVGAGSASTSIDAPVNEAAFDISGPGASVSGFTITTTRSGITVDQASDVAITDVVFSNAANWGIEANEAVNLTVTASAFTMPVYGGIFLSGGTATVDGSVFTEPTSYGIWATGDALLTASNNIFDQVHGTTTDGTDGHAIFGDGATVTMSGNVVTTNDLFGIFMVDSTLSMSGDLIADTPYAVLAFDTALTADGVQIYGAVSQGIYATSKKELISISNTTIKLNGGSTTGLVSCSNTYEARDGFCGGLVVAASEVSISGLEVTDYEQYGVYLVPYNSGELAATVSDLTLDNNGRWSLLISNAVATVDGLFITNHREPDETNTEPCYGYVNYGVAAYFETSSVALSNASIVGSEGWGISLVESDATVTTSTISGAACAGIINYSSSLEVTASTFTQPPETYVAFGAIFDYEGATVLDGNTFVDTKGSYVSDSDDGAGGYIHYVSSGYGRDFITNGSTACLITNNTFSGGDDSLDIENAGCDIVGNSWTGYNGTILQTYQGSESDPITFSGNTVTEHGGMVVYSLYGTTTVEDLVVGDLQNYSYGYSQTWYHADGSFEDYGSYSYEYGQTAFYAYGYYYMYDSDGDGVNDTEYGFPAGLKLENVSMGTVVAGIVQASEGSIEITDLSAESTVGDVVYAYWSHYAPEVEIDGLDVPDVTGSGISLYGNTPDGGYALISDVSLDVVSGNGVVLNGFAEWSMEDVSLVDVGGYGVSSSGSYSYYDYATSTSMYGSREPLITLSGVDVEAATYDSFAFTNGVVSIDSSSALGGGGDGLSLDSVSATVTNNTFATNTGYGMMCVGTTLTACTGNDLGSNTLGAHLDCSDDCSL